MGFLNNSGDIILDAVLTDTGRARLARGDGSFKITKFALADDEIDYSLFDTTAASAQQDLSILQTPVLEAFTNNASSLKSKLLTINLANILYLPVLKVNNIPSSTTSNYANAIVSNGYIVAVDTTTEDLLTAATTNVGGAAVQGLIKGLSIANALQIRVDQGIDSSAVTTLPSELRETQYIVEFDNRFGVMLDTTSRQLTPSYVDDDDIASYFVTTADPSSVISNPVSSTDRQNQANQVITGPRGTILNFGIEASINLKTSTYLFNTLGTSINSITFSGAGTLKAIVSNITVSGGTTGYSISIPIAYVKLIN